MKFDIKVDGGMILIERQKDGLNIEMADEDAYTRLFLNLEQVAALSEHIEDFLLESRLKHMTKKV